MVVNFVNKGLWESCIKQTVDNYSSIKISSLKKKDGNQYERKLVF